MMASCSKLPEEYQDSAWCPGSINCLNANGSYGHSLELGLFAAYPAIVSSTFSCLGSLLIVYTYCRWKDIRTGSRSVVTFLAIADFFTAFGYILGSVNYLVHYGKPVGSKGCATFTEICQFQSFLTTSSSMSSFFWTTALALYLYITLVKSSIVLANKLFPLFHVISWGLPILIVFPLLATSKLGYSPYAVSTWCYIHESYASVDQGISPGTIGLIFVAGKFWEILTYFIILALYISIKCYVRNEAKLGETENYLSSGLVAAVRKADTKLMFIPILFILLRFWGTLHFLFSLMVSKYTTCGCVSPQLKVVFNILGFLQAIGDGGQGWGNVLLYVIASSKIRSRLCGWTVTCLQSSRTNPRTVADAGGVRGGIQNRQAVRRVKNVAPQQQHQLSHQKSAINGVEVEYRAPMIGDFPEKRYGAASPGLNGRASVTTHEPTTEFTNEDN